MGNTYRNRNISLTVLALAIALSTSLSAAEVKPGEIFHLLSGDIKLRAMTYKTQENTPIPFYLDEEHACYEVGVYSFAESTGGGYRNLPIALYSGLYTTETSQKKETSIGTISQEARNKPSFLYTPPSTITKESIFKLVYYYEKVDTKEKYYGNLTFEVSPKPIIVSDNTETVQLLAYRVEQLELRAKEETESMRKEIMLLIENAVSKEERARMREMHQLELKQTQLAAVLSILNCRIDELNATPCSWGGWFKSLWR